MSFDTGVIITKKKKFIRLEEINLSSGFRSDIAKVKTAEEALEKLEDAIKKVSSEGVSYEGIFVEGFKKEGV